MGHTTEKGKIPRSEWSAIRTRYETGKSIASIARHYRCTAPAIRYILRRPLSAGGAAPAHAAMTLAAKEPGAAKVLPPIPRPNKARMRSPISADLHNRITREVSLFLVALDSVLIDPTETSIATLHDASDRLMRAAARVRIELEQDDAPGVDSAPLAVDTR